MMELSLHSMTGTAMIFLLQVQGNKLSDFVKYHLTTAEDNMRHDLIHWYDVELT